MPVVGPAIVTIGSQVVDLASVIMWHEADGQAVVRLETDTFEIDQGDNPIEAEYTITADLASFEAAMQNYLDSLNQALGLLSTEDLDFIMTEDLQYIAV